MGQRLDDDNIATSNYEDYEFEEEENFVAPDQQHQRTDVASILRRDIEDGTGGENDNEEHGGALLNTTLSEEEPSDMQSLLGGGEGHVDGSIKLQPQAAAAALSKDDRPRKKSCFFRCCSTTHASPDPPPPPHGLNAMGNIRIPFPDMYVRTGGWGVIGPHWFGPPCIVLLLSLASYYFVYTCSWQQHRYGTAATGAALALSTLTFLLQAAYQDPGIIRPDRFLVPDPVPRTYRWCEVCNYHQPPRAAHCPDCNVCIAGFDHHCVWMSLCVGKGNFKVSIDCVIFVAPTKVHVSQKTPFLLLFSLFLVIFCVHAFHSHL